MLAHLAPAQEFARRAAAAGAGNFLYLSWLLPAVEEGEQSPRARAIFPDGLDRVYREFMRTRVVGREPRDWRTLYRQLSGVLAAAEEALAGGHIRVEGDRDALARFLNLCSVPG